MEAYLEVRNVSRRFGGLQALDQCSFNIARKQTTCLVGPNGAGKTTIFNIVTGFIVADEGDVTFAGAPLSGLTPRDVIRRGVARTFQNLRLFEEMSPLDNVVVYVAGDEAMGPAAALARPFWTQAAMRRKRDIAMTYLEEVGIAHKARDVTRDLSYGQQKLLCIARALATGADLILLDEPTSGLSQSALTAMVDMVAKLKDSGRTLLIVEHNTRVVQRIADVIVFLHQGRALAQGEPKAILADPALSNIYFG